MTRGGGEGGWVVSWWSGDIWTWELRPERRKLRRDHVTRDAVAVAELLPLLSPNKCEAFH